MHTPPTPRARNTRLSCPMTSRQALTRRRCLNAERPLSDALQTTYKPRRIPAAELALCPTEDCLYSECLRHVALIHYALPLCHTHAAARLYIWRKRYYSGTDRLELVTKFNLPYVTQSSPVLNKTQFRASLSVFIHILFRKKTNHQ